MGFCLRPGIYFLWDPENPWLIIKTGIYSIRVFCQLVYAQLEYFGQVYVRFNEIINSTITYLNTFFDLSGIDYCAFTIVLCH